MKHKNGFTLIEMLVSVFIFAIVLAGIYSLYSFMNRNLSNAQATSDAMDEARMFSEMLDQEVRQVRSLSSGVKGITVAGDGNSVTLATYIDGNPKMVQYQLNTVSGVSKIRRSIYNDGGTPSTWSDVVSNVSKSGTSNYFALDGTKSLTVRMMVKDTNNRISKAVEVHEMFSSRSKGAM